MKRDIPLCGASGQIGPELARQDWPSEMQRHFPERSTIYPIDPATIAVVGHRRDGADVIVDGLFPFHQYS